MATTSGIPSAECFHSTKEGFKGETLEEAGKEETRFHSTKEGFKARWAAAWNILCICFHSTKEGFKGSSGGRSPERLPPFPFH